MPEIKCELTDAQYVQIRDAAQAAGMTIEDFAALATSEAIALRYRPKEVRGNVVSIEGLKSRLRGPPD